MISDNAIIPVLAFVTLGIVIVIAIAQYISIQRSRNLREQTPITQASEKKRSDRGSMLPKS